MSTILSNQPVPAQVSASAVPCLYRLSVEQYEAMAEAGIFSETDRVELIQGLLVIKMTKNPPHSVAARAVAKSLGRLVPQGFFVTREDPIRIPGYSEPEPDVAMIRGESRDYTSRHPEPPDVALLVEVSDSTLEFDRTEKLAMYAAGGITVYWIVNLIDRCVEVYSQPKKGRYRKAQVFEPDDQVPVMINGAQIGTIPVSELLP
jgi:Uma2 family endonuclease